MLRQMTRALSIILIKINYEQTFFSFFFFKYNIRNHEISTISTKRAFELLGLLVELCFTLLRSSVTLTQHHRRDVNDFVSTYIYTATRSMQIRRNYCQASNNACRQDASSFPLIVRRCVNYPMLIGPRQESLRVCYDRECRVSNLRLNVLLQLILC